MNDEKNCLQEQNSDVAMAYGHQVEQSPRPPIHPSHSVHSAQGAHPSQPCPPSAGVQGPLQQQRSFSSSEEERSTPECASDEPDESEKGESTFHFNERVRKLYLTKTTSHGFILNATNNSSFFFYKNFYTPIFNVSF